MKGFVCTFLFAANAFAASITAVGPMIVARQEHTATLLADGTVLIAGGVQASAPDVQEEIYDPSTRTFHAIAGMKQARMGHAAVSLENGRVLLVGGFSISAASSEIFFPATANFGSVASMSGERYHVAAVRLADGRVLAVGGNRGGTAVATSEIYDAATGVWTASGSMTQPRQSAAIVRLNDGRVVVAGGSNASPVEIFDPATGKFSVASNGAVFALHALLLPGGKVLFVGLGRLQTYDPATQLVTVSANMLPTYRGEALVLLPDGTVLIAGGNINGSVLSSDVYIWSPATDALTLIGKLTEARDTPTATLLHDGSVLITGGFTLPDFHSSATAETINLGFALHRSRAVRH